MTSARQMALKAVKVGDVIYGVSGKGNEKLLLVYKRTDTGFFARHVTTKSWAEFDQNGHTLPDRTGGSCTIASVAALTPEQYRVAIGLDHKVRTKAKEEGYNLTPAEIDLILTYGAFFKAHPLPE
eukprot:gene43952-biopygen30077